MPRSHNMVALMTSGDTPTAIHACWLSWVAIQAADQAEVITHLGVTNLRQVSWASGTELIDDIAHRKAGRLSTVVITPAIEGWTLLVGPWCWLPWIERADPLTDLCMILSARFGKAQAYFHTQQCAEAWLIAEDGQVIRRWIGEFPELALGDPFGVERQLLDAYGIPGKPEDLDPDDDKRNEWIAGWGDCLATTIAAESSLDPTAISSATKVTGRMLVADAPAIDYARLQHEQSGPAH